MPPQSAKHPRSTRNFVKEQARPRMCRTAFRRESTEQQREMFDSCNKIGNKLISLKHPIEPDKRETLKILGTSNVRDLLIPSKRTRVYPAIIPKTELDRLKNASKVITLEERLKEMEMYEAEKKRIEDESEKRKKFLKDIDEVRESIIKSNHPINIDEDEENNIKTLDRAFLAKQEREEEIKRANRIILAAKCHVIRHAQVAEKNELAKELKADDIRLEQMMEEERVKAVQEEQSKTDQMKKLNIKHAQEIQEQLKKRELLREVEANRIEEEAKVIALSKVAIQRDEETKVKIKREKTAKIRADLQKVAELSALVKKMEFEEQRHAEMKVQEYMKVREEREKKLALERKLAKEALERKQERLVNLRQKAIQTKEEQIEMCIRREREEKEREYRKREKEAVVRKKQIEKEIIDARMAQVSERKRRTALQIAREEADFQQTLEKLRKEEAREKKLEEDRAKNREKYREEIVKQMTEKELKRKEYQRQAKNEFIANLEKDRNREKTIHSLIKAKINNMRLAKMPEKFIKDVEKQLLFASTTNVTK